jgi:hypothetical protein
VPKTAAELPGIVDEVVTLAEIKAEDGSAYRAFITQHAQPLRLPGQGPDPASLDLQEPPNLRALIDKCATATHTPISIQSGVTHVRMERFQRR